MPLYEYRCHKCGNVFETIQKFSDEPLKVHDDCGGEVERLISVSALQFKGSGWYVNDYAKSGSGAPKEAKTDTKTETKKAEPATTSSTPAPAASSSSSSSSSDSKPSS